MALRAGVLLVLLSLALLFWRAYYLLAKRSRYVKRQYFYWLKRRAQDESAASSIPTVMI